MASTPEESAKAPAAAKSVPLPAAAAKSGPTPAATALTVFMATKPNMEASQKPTKTHLSHRREENLTAIGRDLPISQQKSNRTNFAQLLQVQRERLNTIELLV